MDQPRKRPRLMTRQEIAQDEVNRQSASDYGLAVHPPQPHSLHERDVGPAEMFEHPRRRRTEHMKRHSRHITTSLHPLDQLSPQLELRQLTPDATTDTDNGSPSDASNLAAVGITPPGQASLPAAVPTAVDSATAAAPTLPQQTSDGAAQVIPSISSPPTDSAAPSTPATDPQQPPGVSSQPDDNAPQSTAVLSTPSSPALSPQPAIELTPPAVKTIGDAVPPLPALATSIPSQPTAAIPLPPLPSAPSPPTPPLPPSLSALPSPPLPPASPLQSAPIPPLPPLPSSGSPQLASSPLPPTYNPNTSTATGTSAVTPTEPTGPPVYSPLITSSESSSNFLLQQCGVGTIVRGFVCSECSERKSQRKPDIKPK
ncbi:MAG: hypothetical protein Q9162_002005 [Coniocarpon cinnabarinum]